MAGREEETRRDGEREGRREGGRQEERLILSKIERENNLERFVYNTDWK